MKRCNAQVAAVAFVFAFVVAGPAHAQSVNVLDSIVQQFQSQAAGWESTLASLALQTFGILAAIELAWAGFRLAFRGADVSEWLAEIVNQILFIGFFLALLQNASTWGRRLSIAFDKPAAPPAASAWHRPTCSRPGSCSDRRFSIICRPGPSRIRRPDDRGDRHRNLLCADCGLDGRYAGPELYRHRSRRHQHGLRRLALDQGHRGVDGPLHGLSRCQADDAPAARQHRTKHNH